MCGLTGAVWMDDDHRIEVDQLRRMTDSLSHRGPDDSQTFHDRDHHDGQGRRVGVGLGFRRLSIIDVQGARQPLANETGDIHVVFNGEIYNYPTLRRRLQAAGHRFATDGDGETIVHGYEDLGVDVFNQLNGMFAIAIWDARRSRLILARDRIGQKPLYYAAAPQRIVFGSELKAIAEVPGVCQDIDPAAIDEFLTYQYIPHPSTIWKGVCKLPPGHYGIYDRGQWTVHRYWNFDPSSETDCSESEAVTNVRERLTDAVRVRLRSDVPLGSFLSGGIDSSIITAIASEHSTDPIRTFSIGFPIADFDETAYAAEVAEHLGTRHQRFEVTADGIGIIDDLVQHYDEPFGDSSAVPTWYLSQLARREVTVALSGDGGDELFAGYERYRALWLSQRMQRYFPVGKILGMSIIQRLPDSNRRTSIIRKAKRFLEAIDQTPSRRYLNWLQIFPETLRASLYRDDFVEQLPGEDPFEFLDSVWSTSVDRDVVTRASMADVLSYLPCDLCTKVDVASMAHSLEIRQPMLDYRVVEMAASMPVRHKFRGRRGKLILQKAFGNMIPARIFTRKKMGFGIPVGQWFREQWRDELRRSLLGDDSRTALLLNRDAVEDLYDQHQAKRQNHGYRLWNLLILEKWLRRWHSA